MQSPETARVEVTASGWARWVCSCGLAGHWSPHRYVCRSTVGHTHRVHHEAELHLQQVHSATVAEALADAMPVHRTGGVVVS